MILEVCLGFSLTTTPSLQVLRLLREHKLQGWPDWTSQCTHTILTLLIHWPVQSARCYRLCTDWGKVLEREASLGCWTCRCGWVTLERVRVRTFKSRTAFLSVCPKSSLLLSSLLFGLTYGLGRCQRPSLASTETFFFHTERGKGSERASSLLCACALLNNLLELSEGGIGLLQPSASIPQSSLCL